MRSSGQWCWYHDFDGHNTEECGKFRCLSPDERHETVLKRHVCFVCFQRGHSASSPKCDRHGCSVKVDGRPCNKRHHVLLHDYFVRISAPTSINSFFSRSNVLLETTLAFSHSIPLKIIWDGGAIGSLITHRKAKELGLKGWDYSGYMGGVGDFVKWVDTKVYKVTIHDRMRNPHEIWCFGMDEVAGKVAEFDVRRVASVFPELNMDELIRPHGYCDILIGNDYCHLHPQVVATVGGFQLLRSVFGYSIRGTPPDSIPSVPSEGISVSVLTINNMLMDIAPDPIKQSLDRLFDVECGGVQAPVSTKDLSEEMEMKLIERGLRYDEK